MANDALDPGVDGSYPSFPRVNGVPLWSEGELTDGQPVAGVTPMPRGRRVIRRGQERIVIDVTPTGPDGVPVDPPVLP